MEKDSRVFPELEGLEVGRLHWEQNSQGRGYLVPGIEQAHSWQGLEM